MPRVNKTLAQRYAAASRKRKSEKRRPLPPQPPAGDTSQPTAEIALPAAAPGGVGAAPPLASPTPPAGAQPLRAAPPRTPGRAAPTARRAALPTDYSYVFTDMRRVVLVAGGLLVALVAASFVIR